MVMRPGTPPLPNPIPVGRFHPHRPVGGGSRRGPPSLFFDILLKGPWELHRKNFFSRFRLSRKTWTV